jgi:hypothetical protein
VGRAARPIWSEEPAEVASVAAPFGRGNPSILGAPMADRPIVFSAPMVRALLDGRKTQTRRFVKGVPPQPEADCHERHQKKHPAPYLDSYCSARKTQANPRGMSDRWCWWQVDDRCCLPQFRVPFVPGDRLWVREAFSLDHSGAAICWFWADGNPEFGDWTKPKPSIHMPRWASRLTLTVTAVRVERLQDITEDDAAAEGMARPMAISDFGAMWESIHGPGAWDTNPWVVAVTFTVAQGNIDA